MECDAATATSLDFLVFRKSLAVRLILVTLIIVNFISRSSIMAKKGGSKRGRDAKTGEFIPVKEAERRKSTAIVETVKPRRRGSKKK